MAENPTLTIARILGGLSLLQGNLGHQILGQLLITNSNEVAIAGAAGVVAATSGQRNAAAQIAIRTALPALAVRGLLLKQEQRVERRETAVADRERQLDALSQTSQKNAAAVKRQATQIEQLLAERALMATERDEAATRVTVLTRRVAALDAERRAAASTIAALESQFREQLTENTAFRADTVRQSGLKIDAPQRPKESTDASTRPTESATGSKKSSTPRRPRKPRKPKA